MLTVGLTGPSGAGKSVVGSLFAECGIPVLDADRIYHDLLIPPSACLDEIAAHFGKEILAGDGTLDRAKLGKIVFSDADALAALNAVAHRHVMREMRRQAEGYRLAGKPAVVYDAPQLFEAGADRDCDVVVSVLAAPEIRIARMMARDGITRERAIARMAAQKSDDFFRAHSDYVLENDGTDGNFARLREQVREILSRAGGVPK